MKPFDKKPYESKEKARPARPKAAGDKPSYPFKSEPPKGDKPTFQRKQAPKFLREERRAQIPTEARRVALEALMDVEAEGAFSTLSLDRRLREATSLSPEDRRLATALFYGVLERRLTLDFALKQCMERPPEDILTYTNLRMGALQILFMEVPDYAACGEAVSMSRFKGREALCPLVNGVLRRLSRIKGEIPWPTDPMERLSILTSTPLWLAKYLVDELGLEEAQNYLSYRPAERYLTVRINLMRTQKAKVQEELTALGMSCKESPLPDALRVSGGSPADTDGFRKGFFSIQGEASMLAVLALGIKGGMQVLDACAAPGGKACFMAERMNGSGRVHAMDVRDHRVKLIEAQAKRLGLENIRPRVGNAEMPIDSLKDSLHAVLVDAPCSGLGVIHSKPDIKFNMDAQSLEKLPPKQLAILDACSQAVRPGGVLVYSTCTILQAENEEVVKSFLESHKEFELDGLARQLPSPFAEKVADGMLTLLPQRDDTDGFFIARMVRRK